MNPMNTTMQKTTDTADSPQPMPATILLVEDETAVREVTREALEMGGYRVLEASGAQQATNIASDRSMIIDLLLTDVVMPGISGLDLACQLRQSRPGLVTLFMTGYAEGEILRTVTPEVLQNHIQKPFTVNGLLSRVAGALAARWRSADEYRSPQFPTP